MEKQELLEKLAQLQKGLEDIESARKMVDETVNAYKGGAKQIKAYSEQLSQVSEKIGQLIEQIKQNKDALSSEVDVKINTAITKIERAASSFTDKTVQQIDGFEGKTNTAINDLNNAVNGFVGGAKQAINQAAEASKASQKDAKDALNEATTKMETTIKDLTGKNEKLLTDFKASVDKKITIVAMILAVLMVANIVIHFIR